MPENTLQMRLIERKAKELWLKPDDIVQEWVDNFSPKFRELWDKWERDMGAIEDSIYTQELGSNYADVVHALITQ